MPFIKHSTYRRAPFWQFNGDLQTIIPSFRKVEGVTYERETLTLPDGDFVDLDWIDQKSRRLVILTHGLEGSSTRPYMLGAAKIFANNGFDVLAWNCRSCGGEMNRHFRLYNHGDIGDIEQVVNQALNAMTFDTEGCCFSAANFKETLPPML